MNYLEMMVNAQRRLGITETKSTQNNTDSDVVELNVWFNEQLAELQGIHLWSFLQKTYYLPQGSILQRTCGFPANSTSINVEASGSSPTPTAGIIPNRFIVSGPGINPNTRVIAVPNSFQVIIDQPTAERQLFASLTFTQDTFDLPPDFDRMTDQTMWSGGLPLTRREPRSPNQWQWDKHIGIVWGPQVRFLGDSIRINPTGFKGPLSFEYTSNASVQGQDGTWKNYFSSDTDTTLYDNEMVILGVIARARAHQQFDPSVALELYQRRRGQMIARDGGMQTVSLTNYPNNRYYLW